MDTTITTRSAEAEKTLADLYADAHRALTAAMMAAMDAGRHDESHAMSECATIVHRQGWKPATAGYEALAPMRCMHCGLATETTVVALTPDAMDPALKAANWPDRDTLELCKPCRVNFMHTVQAPAPTAKRATPKPVATRLECLECGHKFSKRLGDRGYFDIQCPHCGGYDIDVL